MKVLQKSGYLQTSNDYQVFSMGKTNILKKIISLLFFISVALHSHSQNEYAKWYFGEYSALDFMTNPPSILNTSAMLTRGCSSIADAAGNLLFYTNGLTVWNKQHTIMANGTLAFAGGPNTAYPMIVKQPGNSNLYYIFRAFPEPYISTWPIPPTTTGLYYSVVDMSLAAGIGSVTVNNALIYTTPYYSSTGQLHATKHANGVDYWIMIHEYPYANFRAYLLSAAGISLSPVVSSIGLSYQGELYYGGYMKFSPTGQKLCISVSYAGVELYDFDTNSGLVSNPLTLVSDALEKNYRGCEFSPDGTKLYVGHNIAGSTNSKLIQWDLSAGTSAAIASSSVNIPSNSLNPTALQLAPNGKVYIASPGSLSLSVINNPNAAGIACNFVAGGQPISAAINATINPYSPSGLPNMITNITNTPCISQSVGNPQSICAGSVYAISDHTYTTAGAYVDTLQNVFGCNGIVIVNTQLTVKNLPISVSPNSTICVNEQITLTATGADTYTWSTLQTGAGITVTPVVTTIYTVYGADGYGCESTSQILVSVSPCTGVEELKSESYLIENEDLEIFPNPADDYLELKISIPNLLEEFHSTAIYNHLGQLVREEDLIFKHNSLKIKTTDLPEGVYSIRLTIRLTIRQAQGEKSNTIGILTKRFLIAR